jgi:hypothetical protein
MSSALPGRELTKHTISTARHTTGYIASGREDRRLMIFSLLLSARCVLRFTLRAHWRWRR